MLNHAIIQIRSKIPVRMNAPRHPRTWPPMEICLNCATTHGSARGTSKPPTFEPELKMPVARARSRFGNHSAVVLMAAGKFPPSPNPSIIRAIKNPVTLLASECPIEASPQNPQARANPRRNPMTSIKRPTTSKLNAYAALKHMVIYQYWPASQPISFCSSGARFPKTPRSI